MTTAASDIYLENLDLFRRELHERRLVMQSKPLTLGIVLTTRCNLRCIMCTRVWKRGDVPASIMDKARPLYPTLREIQWQGGEVFVVDFFKDIFEEAASHPHINQGIITSGSLIDRDWAFRLARAKTGLTLSIDSVVPKTYASIRRGTTFERLLETLRHLREAGASAGKAIPKNMHFVLMRENFDELPLLIPFAAEHGFSQVEISPQVPLIPGAANADDPMNLRVYANMLYAGNLPAFRKELEWISAAQDKAQEQARTAGIRLEDRAAPIVRQLLKREAGGEVRPANAAAPADDWDCLIPWRGLYVMADRNNGDIFPDCMCSLPIGNIESTGLLEAWNNERMQEYRRRVLFQRLHGWCTEICATKAINPIDWFSPRLFDFLRPPS